VKRGLLLPFQLLEGSVATDGTGVLHGHVETIGEVLPDQRFQAS
jgi:hypothetical protein